MVPRQAVVSLSKIKRQGFKAKDTLSVQGGKLL